VSAIVLFDSLIVVICCLLSPTR